MKSRYNPILIAIMAIGLLFASWLNYNRYQIEENNNTVEMAMEYEALVNLAEWEGHPVPEVLTKFKNAGVTAMIVFDTTLQKLNNQGLVISASGRELLQNSYVGGQPTALSELVNKPDFRLDAVYVMEGSSHEAFCETEKDLSLRYAKDRIKVVSENPRIIRVIGYTRVIEGPNLDTKLGLMQAPLGLSSAEMKKLGDMGFNIIIRPQNYLPVDEKCIDGIFERVDKAGVNVSSCIGCGKEIVGYPHKLDYMAEKLTERDINLGMVEHYTQLQFAPMEGLIPMAESMDYKVARAYLIDRLEMRKISVPNALRRWALTDEERNIRINYILPFMIPRDGQDLLQMNLDYVTQISKNVKERGYDLGESAVFTAGENAYEAYFPNKLLLIPVALAIVAGCILYLQMLTDMKAKTQLMLLAIFGAVSSGIVATSSALLVRQLLSLVAACVFPVLSMAFFTELWNRSADGRKSLVSVLLKATVHLAGAVFLSLCGATLMSAIIGDIRFFLEIDIYRGVKLTFVMPIVLMAIWYLKRFNVLNPTGDGDFIKDCCSLLKKSIKIEHLVLVGVLGIVALIFIGRSGHSAGIPVPAIELKMRYFLEEVMYARPRQKEFMIGHPAFYLALYAAYINMPRLWQFAFAVAAVIGQGSLVQTFAHMRTPVMMSYIRAVDGYVVGVCFGVIAVIGLAVLLPYLRTWQRRYLEDV